MISFGVGLECDCLIGVSQSLGLVLLLFFFVFQNHCVLLQYQFLWLGKEVAATKSSSSRLANEVETESVIS